MQSDKDNIPSVSCDDLCCGNITDDLGEGIKVSKILEFPATNGFGKWKNFFPKDSVAHPAKANLYLLEYLIREYTNEGDTILDPMAGSGSTGVISALNGRNAVLVELEDKFVKWIDEAKRKVDVQQTITPKGKIVVIKGDARYLPELLKDHKEDISKLIFSKHYKELYRNGDLVVKSNTTGVNCILFSPPYSDTYKKSNTGTKEEIEARKERLRSSGIDPDAWNWGNNLEYPQEYSKDPNNIGNLSYDACVFSPPYSLGHNSGDNASDEYDWRLKEQKKHTDAYSDTNNIAKIPFREPIEEEYNVSTILFSPPYESSLEGSSRHTKGGIASRDPKMAQSGTYATTMSFGAPVCYSPDMINIGNLKMTTDEIDPTIIRLRDHGRNDPTAGGNFGRSLGHPYSYSDDNIGNLRSNKNENKGSSETYIDAMLKVYLGCYTVLKPGGRMIVIVKDFIRNFKVIRLHDHTRFLCEQCGFVFDEMLAFKLPTKSFWRTLYEKKHGDKVKDINLLNYELVLMFHKPKPKSI